MKHSSFKKADVVLRDADTNEWQGGSLKISIVVFAKSLQKDGDDSHDGLDDTELKCGLDDISNRSQWVMVTVWFLRLFYLVNNPLK